MSRFRKKRFHKQLFFRSSGASQKWAELVTKAWPVQQLSHLGGAKSLQRPQPPPKRPWSLLASNSSHERWPGARKPLLSQAFGDLRVHAREAFDLAGEEVADNADDGEVEVRALRLEQQDNQAKKTTR